MEIQALLQESTTTLEEKGNLYYHQGLLLSSLEQYELAINSFNKMIQIKPKDPDVWSSRGHALVNLGRYKEALESYQKSLQIQPNNQVIKNKIHNIDDNQLFDQECNNQKIVNLSQWLQKNTIEPNWKTADEFFTSYRQNNLGLTY